MSWCRLGSTCEESLGAAKCALGRCPGSALYLYGNNNKIVCCACSLDGVSQYFVDYSALLAHLERHAAAGDHFSAAILGLVRNEIAKEKR
jgi:hypothetical protein